MKILIVAAGSHGDVLPFVGLGREVQRRGHEVRLFASAPFATIAAEAGLPFVEVMSAAEYQRFLADRDATDPMKGMALLAQAVAGAQRRCQALRAGTPQLVRPMGFDQFDNARRAVTLGVARQLLPRRYEPAAVVRALDGLATEPSVQARCAEWARTLAGERAGTEVAADAIVALAARRGLAS